MKFATRASCFAIAMAAGLAATPAYAACGYTPAAQPASWQPGDGLKGLFHQSDYASERSIVGLWQFTMVSNGATVDFGYTQWHSDGTELMNSGGRAPATENFCMGVYTQIGTGRYRLTHYALSYDTSGALNGRVVIKETVAVAAGGATYTGQFTLDVYDPNSNALVHHVAGQVNAQRVVAS